MQKSDRYLPACSCSLCGVRFLSFTRPDRCLVITISITKNKKIIIMKDQIKLQLFISRIPYYSIRHAGHLLNFWTLRVGASIKIEVASRFQ